MPSLYDSDADSNDYHPYGNQGLYYDSYDDENRTASLVRTLLEYIDLRIAAAEPMEAPSLYDPNLTVTFSDEEEDEAIEVPLMGQHDILPVPKYLIYLGHEANFGFHDYIPLESTVYDIEDVKISIKGPINLAAITDHPSYYFLTQVKEELDKLDDEIKSSKYLCPTGITEIHFDLGLLATKILHYASHYGHSTSPSTIRTAQFQFLGPNANARTTIYTGYIETFGDDLVFAHRIDHSAMDNWEHVLNAPHDDDGPPCKRSRIGDYIPGDNEPERYSPTSPEYCP
jgi:hypothetical protein